MSDAAAKAEKRLAFLEKLTSSGSDDPMAWYGLAMEYRKLERWDDSLRTFTSLRDRKADYVALYLMCGQMLSEAGRKAEARTWMEAGMTMARSKGDSHALGELESALSTLDD